jgi:two-component system, cell cycle sensor histidine kinase and response regulator CckA
MNYLVLNDETARLEALRRYQVLDTSPEEAFDDLVKLAVQICDTPIGLINLVDANRQWFKAKVGLDVPEMPRDIGLCPACLEKGDILIVPDTLLDAQFATYSVVTGEPHVRFYAGIPLKTREGHLIGTICVVDVVPKEITAKQIEGLRSLARLVMRQLDIRCSLRELELAKEEHFQDVTKRRQAEDNFNCQQEIFNSINNVSPLGFYVVNKCSGEIFYHNHRFCEIWGIEGLRSRSGIKDASQIESGELKNSDIINEYKKQVVDVVEFIEGDKSIHNQNNVGVAEDEISLKDGRIIRRVSTNFREKGECCNGRLYIFEDITVRKRTEHQIRVRAALLDITSDAIVLRDLAHKTLLWNQGAEKLYGWKTEEVIGKNAKEILYRGKPSHFPEIYNTVLNQGFWQGELARTTKYGKEIIVESRWTLVYDEHLEPKSILTIDTDITQKKQLEKQFLRVQRMESIGTLASGIAHDLNNVLSPIVMSAQLLKNNFHDQGNLQILEIVENNAKRGADLVKQVVSFVGGMEGNRTIVQLQNLILEIKQMIEQTFPKTITFQHEIQSDLLSICGDNTQLHQVLVNLCLNARDAMLNGGLLAIKAENIIVDKSYVSMNIEAFVGSYVLLTVTDTGIGIDGENLERIFDPFFTTKEFGKGTGLGLSSVMGIIKGHGGFINVSSRIGKGTIFKVYLPAVANQAVLPSEDVEIVRGNGELILVVDDEPAIREITKVSLENYNYQVMIANDGIEAIALFAQHKKNIKAAIIDMMMPNMDGSTAIHAIHRINPLVPIIAVSGLLTNEQFPISKESNLTAFLPKPYTAQKLLKTLRQLIDNVNLQF